MFTTFWGEQQVTVAIVAVACIFSGGWFDERGVFCTGSGAIGANLRKQVGQCHEVVTIIDFLTAPFRAQIRAKLCPTSHSNEKEQPGEGTIPNGGRIGIYEG